MSQCHDPSAASPAFSNLRSASLGEAPTVPNVRLRGRSLLALVVAPEFPMGPWFAAFDAELRGSGLFLGRPIVADLKATVAGGGAEAAPIVLEGLEARGLRLVGVEGVDAAILAGTRWEGLSRTLPGREMGEFSPSAPAAPPSPASLREPEAAPARPVGSLLIDRPVRSGQSVVFEAGDVIILGAVGSGAEVIAGGSIHVYGALRGRAIAGLRAGEGARIFCRRLEAEMVGVGRLYRTAEHWGPALHGRPAQVWCDRGSLRLSALD